MEEKPVPQEHGFKHKKNVRIWKGLIKPNYPREKGTTGGTIPLTQMSVYQCSLVFQILASRMQKLATYLNIGFSREISQFCIIISAAILPHKALKLLSLFVQKV